jgi:hypothetical protein
MNWQALALALIVLGIPVALALVGLAIGQTRGWPGLGLVLGLFLGPLGWLIAFLLPDARPTRPSHLEANTPAVPRLSGDVAPGSAGESCPHCGARLPTVRDAFCPDCFGPLDEGEPESLPAGTEESSAPPNRLALLTLFGCIGSLVLASSFLLRGNIAEAIYSGVVGAALALIAFIRLNRRS